MLCTTRYYYLFIRFSFPNSLFIHFVLFFVGWLAGTLKLYSGYEAIICGNKLGKQYAMAVTEQEDLCRQNRKSFFSSSSFLSFFPSIAFIFFFMLLLPRFLSPFFAHSACVCVYVCIFVDFLSQND